MSELIELAKLEVGSDWVWTSPLVGAWFQLNCTPALEGAIEVAQGDGQTIIGQVLCLRIPSQTVYLPSPDVLDVSDRRLAFRTSEAVKFQSGWKVRVLPVAEISQPIDQQILALLQQMQTSEIDGGVLDA
jgi:hypothetical protein